MLKVKKKYLHQKPPHCKIRLGEFNQRQLENLPDYLKKEYCIKEVKNKKSEV